MKSKPRAEATSTIIADVIRQMRRRLNVSQERLSLLADVERTYVGKIERGIFNPTIHRVHRLLAASGVSWAEFGAALDAELAAQSGNKRST
jgi:transcriptional regulator with XRE-family HTH domain